MLTDTFQINRQGAGMGGEAKELHEKGEVGYAWRVSTLGEFADLVEEAFEKEGKQREHDAAGMAKGEVIGMPYQPST